MKPLGIGGGFFGMLKFLGFFPMAAPRQAKRKSGTEGSKS
jgi:hypothetical protein